MDPVLFAVDEDDRLLRDIERELVDRYSRSYRIVCAGAHPNTDWLPAAGDVRNGSMSRVASAVGEGSIAIRLVHELFAAEHLRAGDGAGSRAGR